MRASGTRVDFSTPMACRCGGDWGSVTYTHACGCEVTHELEFCPTTEYVECNAAAWRKRPCNQCRTKPEWADWLAKIRASIAWTNAQMESV